MDLFFPDKQAAVNILSHTISVPIITSEQMLSDVTVCLSYDAPFSLPGVSMEVFFPISKMYRFELLIYRQHYCAGQQYFHLNMYRPPIGKRTFQAKVTKNFPSGYSIETIIDGKPLHGILFPTSATNLSSQR